MLEVYRKVYENKITKEVSYYFFINNHGIKKYYETVYELVSDVNYYYSRYTINLEGEIKNKAKIETDVMKYAPIILENTKGKRRLSVLAKFVLYVIAVTNNASIYKLPKEVRYHNNGIEMVLSPNAFIKSSYKLIPFFERVYKQ